MDFANDGGIRHLGGGNIVMTDSHAKWYPSGINATNNDAPLVTTQSTAVYCASAGFVVTEQNPAFNVITPWLATCYPKKKHKKTWLGNGLPRV